MTWTVIQSDALSFARSLPTGCASLTLFSPPYEDARTYGIGFRLKGQAWVDWLAPIIVELARCTNGLVLCNAAGKVNQFKYSPVVEWLCADLTRVHGLVCGPSPYVFHRVGIPGSGSKHYHRRDWEPVYAFARPEVLPLAWSDNTATGHAPKWAPGGEMSHRLSDGTRRNQWGGNGNGSTGQRRRNGSRQRTERPSSVITSKDTRRGSCGHDLEGSPVQGDYSPPAIANAGNVIKCKVGGNNMGSVAAHLSEAPYPESLCEFFIRSFAPPAGLVLDPFCGSGTTLAVAVRWGRRALGCDIRQSQIDIARRRIEGETPLSLLREKE